MIDLTSHREIVSGRRRGLGAWLIRGMLWLASGPYAWAVSYRNRQYDRTPARVWPVEVPVICVGNITTGGTGKTPLVAWLARWLRAKDVRVSIVSRGYGATQGGPNDEALQLEQALPDVPHVENADRFAAARLAIDELDTQLILLDDGFQHRRLARDLDIVLLDALNPFGHGYLLPRGLLRESLAGLSRAQVIGLSRADLVTAAERSRIRQTVARYAPSAVWIELRHAPKAVVNASGERLPLSALDDKSLAAFCGIGNPDGFRATLNRLTGELVGFREFVDHYDYQRDDLGALARWAQAMGAKWLVCTEKDLVKIGADAIEGVPVYAIAIELEITAGKAELEAILAPLVHDALDEGE